MKQHFGYALGVAAALGCTRMALGQAGRGQPTPVAAGTPKISPDGAAILFLSNRDGSRAFYTMSPTGENVRRVTPPDLGVISAVWAGDAAHVLVIARAAGTRMDSTRLLLGDLASGTWKQIAGGRLINSAASLDGRRVVFSAIDPAAQTGDLYMIGVAGAEAQPLTTGAGLKFGPVLSPDGKRLAFIRAEGRGSMSRLWIAKADASEPRPITSGDQVDEQPAWSPSGEWIAFQTSVRGKPRSDIALVRPDGTGRRTITLQPEDVRIETPSWFPDGKRLAVQSNRDGTMRSYVIDLTGKTLATLPAAPNLP
jgi:Tol biopolymer transport system component